jgi:ribokinase
MEQLDFLAIGDIVSEPFIQLIDAEIRCEHGQEDCMLCMRYGDKIPYDHAVFMPAVGNASNAAVSAARLGLKSGLRAYVGNDSYGTECLEVLKGENVDTTYMVTESGKKTNYHFVLWYKTDRTILVKHEEFSYEPPELEVSPKWIYLSSLADHSLPYHQALIELLKKHPDTKLAFNPGTFQMKMGIEALKEIYQRSELFVVNKEEAERILNLPPEQDIKDLLNGIHALGPKIVALTDGTKGAYASDGNEMLFVPMYPDQAPPFERTGAGDAFASSVASALAIGKPLHEALLWGPINSMCVVQKVGAREGLITRDTLEMYLARAPESYKVTPL